MTVAKLGRQCQRSTDSYLKSSREYSYLFQVIHYYFIPFMFLKHIIYIYIERERERERERENLLLLTSMYSLNSTITLRHLSY
jgi:hypothetical protein